MALLAPAIGAGAIVGFVLGLIGAGGSIMATPLLVYAVGVASPHVAIGTGAVAVAASAAANLAGHARLGNVRWRCALVFAAIGMIGAWLGAMLGKSVDGQRLLALFGVLMIVVGIVMLARRGRAGRDDVRLTPANAASMLPKLVAAGGLVGLLSGFFGIGGGFLIVPALIAATGMSTPLAIGTSLVAVAAFGATTAASYAISGLVDWTIAALFVAGGALGGIVGVVASRRLAARKSALGTLFGFVVIGVGTYVAARGLPALFG